VPVPPALVALKVTFDVPAGCGVPEIRPVNVFTDNLAADRRHQSSWDYSWP
jgi:hypothetical protein